MWAPGKPPYRRRARVNKPPAAGRGARKKAPQRQTRRQGAHIGGGGGGKEPTRALPRSEVHLGAGKSRIGAGKSRVGACPSAPSPNPFRAPTPRKGEGRGGEGRNGGGPWRSPCRERPWSVLRGTERPRPYESPDMVSESWLGGATYPALHYRTPSAGKEGIQPSV